MQPSAHVDTFARDRLPAPADLPEFLFTLPELQFPPRLNCAAVAVPKFTDLSVDATKARHVTPLPDAQQSALGQWITHMGQRTGGGHARFIELKQEHLRFHALACQALDHARNHRMDLASNLLNTEFERSRARVLDMLRSLQKT